VNKNINTTQTHILIKGARVHNLKNVSTAIQRNKFTVITGVSGSGKSSLALDTLYAEGHRRYVESLSSYARQFLGRINKPEVDYIKGIPPAIAIERKVNTRNSRSTVGTSSEIYDYLKLLFARVGHTISPVSGKEIKRHTVTDVVDYINSFDNETKMAILSPIIPPDNRSLFDHINILEKQGFTRIELNKEFILINELPASKKPEIKDDNINLVIDRISVNKNSEDNNSRLADSVQTAFYEGNGECIIEVFNNNSKIKETKTFTNRFEADGITFEEPTVNLFAFNNPFGACPRCNGTGSIVGIDKELIIPDKNLSVYNGAIKCWSKHNYSDYIDTLINNANKFDFPIFKPYYQLSEKEQNLLWTGNKYFKGLNEFFDYIRNTQNSYQSRLTLSFYSGKIKCPDCNGSRLRKEASYVKVGGKSINDLAIMPVSGLRKWFTELKLSEHDESIAKRLLIEINSRLEFVCLVGLGYINLNRLSSTLSGGESQRINLATSLGSSLIGSLYILDEPSIGLHTRDTKQLVKVLKKLRDIGNTVVVVEHDTEIINSCDEIIDIGPGAGRNGGQIVFQGPLDELEKAEESLTAKYLTGNMQIKTPTSRRSWNKKIELKCVSENNLKKIDVIFPLNVFTVVTGVSGSGKTSLVMKALFPAVRNIKGGGYHQSPGDFGEITGDLDAITYTELIDQNSIGKSSRSNPATYLKAWEEIRQLLASTNAAQNAGLKPSHFSFNTEGGRCEECKGDGKINVEMQFMADIELVCESCNGQRFKPEVLDITYQGKNVYDILEMSVEEAIEFFSISKNTTEKSIVQKLQPLSDVGLGYVKLGQSSNTLSGGESQRIKLASYLSLDNNPPTLFIFDEPTTGLHINDIQKLLKSFDALIEKGHTVIVIEHNMDVIKMADYVIDLGPEGGSEGGYLVFSGTPENLIKEKKSYTGQYLKKYL
jgi:excinuclease ABC subunit A